MKRIIYLVTLFILFTTSSVRATLTGNFTLTHTAGCAPLGVGMTDATIGGAPTYFRWYIIADSSCFYPSATGLDTIYTSTFSNIFYNFTIPCTYTVTERAAFSTDTAISSQVIVITPQPFVSFTVADSLDTVNVCPPATVHFINTTTDTSTSCSNVWVWTIFDNTGSYVGLDTAHDLTYTYSVSGTYKVKLNLFTNCAGCSPTSAIITNIKIDNIPVAGFTMYNTDTICSLPAIVNYTNTSTGATHYLWKFGDGTTSTAVNPVHSFTARGTYSDTLIVYSAGGCTDTFGMLNDVYIPLFTHGFTVSALHCVGIPVTVTDTTAGHVSYFWTCPEGVIASPGAPSTTITFSTSGSYLITDTVRTVAGCKGVTTHAVTILPSPVVTVSATPLYWCKINDLVTFTSNAISPSTIQTWAWNFGNPASGALNTLTQTVTATSETATHTYSTFGTYTGNVTVTDINGCYASAGTAINLAAPSIGLNLTKDSGCIPLVVNYSIIPTTISPAAIASIYSVVSVAYGDGAPNCIGASCVPGSHTYTSTARYKLYTTFSLPASVGGCVWKDSILVHPGIVVPNFNVSPAPNTDSVCPNSIVALDDGCTNCTSRFWKNVSGPGRIGGQTGVTYTSPPDSSENPALIHLTTPGKDSIVWYGNVDGCYSVIGTNVWVFGPLANFTATTPNCTNPYTVLFVSTANTGVGSLYWDFNDGDTYTSVAPVYSVSYTFPSLGEYSVALLVTGDAANHFCTNTDTQVLDIFLIIDTFTASTKVACVGSAITFTATVSQPSGVPYSNYLWKWGDGSPNTSTTNPIQRHIYHADGVFSPTLTITNRFGCDTTYTIPNYIKIFGPITLLSIAQDSLCPGSAAVFTDNTTDDTTLVRRIWEFSGPGGTRSIGTPGTVSDTSYTYNTTGNHQVCVIDVDTLGCADSVCVNFHVLKPAAFITSIDSGLKVCAGIPIYFCDTNRNCTYIWNFGDGSTTTVTTPCVSHIYTANGTFSDTVIIITGAGSGFPIGCMDTAVLGYSITLANINISLTNVGATATNCPPLNGSVYNTTAPPQPFYWWRFDSTLGVGVGHRFDTNPADQSGINYNFTIPGAYTVTLLDSNALGCKDSASVAFLVGGPSGYVTLLSNDTGCVPLNVSFMFIDTTSSVVNSYLWVLGASTSSATATANVTYATAGTYDGFTLLISSFIASGSPPCYVNLPVNYTISAYPLPTLTVTSPPLLCNGGNTIITATGADSYIWTPATGLSCTNCPSPTASPTVSTSYFITGYTIHGCIDTESVSLIVDTPLSVTIHGKDSICRGLNDTLYATGIGGGVYSWTHGIGSLTVGDTDIIYNPLYTEVDSLTGMDGRGCKAYSVFTVTVNPLPIITYFPLPAYVCFGDSTQLTASVKNTPIDSFIWQPKYVGALSCNVCASPWSSTLTDIIYTVVAVSHYGCADSMQVPVTVYSNNPIAVRNDTVICIGSSAELWAKGGMYYAWTPTNSLNNPDIQTPIATPDTTTTYTVYVTVNVCFVDTGHVTVTVVPLPTYILSGPVTVIAGSETQLSVVQTNDFQWGVTFAWKPADSTLSCFDCTNPMAIPTNTTTYTVVATTIQGCKDSSDVKITVICETSQVFIPNTFTPNGDGVNDDFYVSGRGLGLIKRMAIYNRWGQLVFETENVHPNHPGSGWDGTFKGQILEPDVFVYVIDLFCETGVPFHFTGDISLVR